MNFGSYTNLTSLFTSIGNKLRKKVSFELKTQAEYNALVQAGTVDPNVDYHIYDASITAAPVDDTTTASDKVWSSNKTNTEISAKATLDDSSTVTNKVWSSKKTSDEIVNRNKATILTVSTSSWATDTTSQSGTTLYKKEISLSHVYVPCPEVAIGASGTTLPTKDQQTAYDLVQYATVDSSTNKLYLYASAVPSTQFYIKVTGVD